MSRLRNQLDKIQPLFSKGGRLERFQAVYEMVDTFLFTPGDVTRGSPHVRDAIDLKRVMIFVVLAVTPAALLGMYNIGLQANSAMAAMGASELGTWQGSLIEFFGIKGQMKKNLRLLKR